MAFSALRLTPKKNQFFSKKKVVLEIFFVKNLCKEMLVPDQAHF